MYQTKENGTIQSLPYDKFLQQGAENLTEEELIAIILRTGTRGEDALTLACRVLSVCDKRHGILGLHHVTLDQLMQVKGIGLVKAVKLKAIAELSRRMAVAEWKRMRCSGIRRLWHRLIWNGCGIWKKSIVLHCI